MCRGRREHPPRRRGHRPRRRPSLPPARASTPQDIGLAASVGLATLPVFRRLRVAVSSPATNCRCRASRSSPAASTTPTATRCAACSPRSAARCATLASCRTAWRRRAPRCAPRRPSSDVIVTSGGVSVGEEDHVKAAVQAEGALDLWKIAIKPGKPLAFGRVNDLGRRAWAAFIGLPGNPVSSFVTFLMLVRPFVLRLPGRARHCAARADARRLRLAPAGPAARVPARAHRRRWRPRPVSQPELRRADLLRLGRRPGGQSAGAGGRAASSVRFIPFSELYVNDASKSSISPACARRWAIPIRNPGPARAISTVGALHAHLAARGGAWEALARDEEPARRGEPADGRPDAAVE
jgi:hypothetical protein